CAKRSDARGKHRLAFHLARRDRLYAHALEMGDIRAALAVDKDQALLEGLYRHDDPGGLLEKVFALLPTGLAGEIRAALASVLSGGGPGGGGEPPAGAPPPGPGPDHDGGGDGAGPVAGEGPVLPL